MTLNYFTDVLFDLINDSELLNVHDIRTMESGYRVTMEDGTLFDVTVSKAEPVDNVVQLYPE